MGVYRPMTSFRQDAAREEEPPALLNIGSMSPTGYPSAWLRPRSARFRFAWPDHCSSTTSIRLNFQVALVLARHPEGTETLALSKAARTKKSGLP
jgi:hypothetical protein